MVSEPESRFWKNAAAVIVLGLAPVICQAGQPGIASASTTATALTTDPVAVPLDPKKPYYFSKYQGNRSELLELNTDGTYRLLDRRHQWVKETDRGIWQMGTEAGAVTMISAGYFEGVRAGVLSSDLVSTSTLDNLTSISLALADVVTSVGAAGGVVSVRDFRMMMHMHPADTSREVQVDGKRAYGPEEQAVLTLEEIKAFETAVSAALAAPVPTSETLTLRKYDGITYLDVPETKQSPWAGMSYAGGGLAAIKRRDPAGRIFETFVQVPEVEYRQVAATVQPWLFVPDLATMASAEAMERREMTASWPDPAIAPVAALKTVVPDLEVESRPTSTPEELSGMYSSTGPTTKARIGGGLSGRLLYLFPDGEYLYLDWADIKPRTIESRGRWHLAHGYIAIKDDGSLKPKYSRLEDHAFLPLSFTIDGMRPRGLLGFPEAYERVFAKMDPRPHHILFGLLERTENLKDLGDWKAKREELMRKHWRPDWVAGVKGAKAPEW